MKSFCLGLIAVFSLSLVFFGPAAQGQDFETVWELKPIIGSELSGWRHATLHQSFPDRGCRGVTRDVGISYPTNTGSKGFDGALANIANKKFTAFAEQRTSNCEDAEYGGNEASSRTTFVARAPGKNHASILFVGFAMPAGANRPTAESEALVVDLRTGIPVGLTDIFENPSQAIPALWPKVIEAWCRLGGELPEPYTGPLGNRKCGRTPVLPDALKANYVPLSALGSVILTPDGMLIRLDSPYAGAIGPQEVTISKRDLLALGAKGDIWQ
ncbi:MAG: hypothetical protein LBJ61_00925 [Deltaproteobacteria bacterium]|jgi:hypothetical protein|nr:hypothetical protein [Deltaproteobacteria bacterium]